MASPDWTRLKDIFGQALELAPEDRAPFLDTACRQPDGSPDPDLRSAVERLLADDEEEAGILDSEDVDAFMPILGAAAAREQEGRRVGPYQLAERVGEGGMGEVYRAERADGAFEQTVALKLVKRGMDTDAVLRRFEAERSILARLDHPGIARLLGGGVTDDGRPWFAMEYVEGNPITVTSSSLGLAERLNLFDAVCAAVQHAHARLVVHRDLKPSNILVVDRKEGASNSTGATDIEPGIKLLDFGIAKLLDAPGGDASVLTVTGIRPMTRPYAAPEQIRGETITVATDVYALGVVLYELLTGRRPFEATTISDLEQQILDTDPTAPSAALRREESTGTGGSSLTSRQLVGDLDVICLKALRKEPEARYASAEAFREDLRRYRAGLPVIARAPTAAYRVRRFIRRNRLGVAAAALVAVVLIGGVTSTLLQARQTRIEAARSEATADFLARLFDEADPTAGAMSLSALDLVDRGARRIDLELADQPDVRARLLSVVGEAYLGLGRPDSAQSLAERVLALRQPDGAAPDAAEAVRTRILLGQAHFVTDPAQGSRELAAAVETARGVGDAVLLDALEAQARLAGNEVLSPAETVAVIEEAVALCRQIEGEGSPRLGRLLTLLAFKVSSVHQHGRVEGLLREALGSLPADEAPYERSVALVDLANWTGATGQTEASREAINEALALRRRVLVPGDPRIAEALAVRAQGGTGTPEEDERDAREAVQIAADAGDGAIEVEALNALGASLMRQERYDEAVEVFRHRFEMAEEVFGIESTRYPAASSNIARSLHAGGRYDEAAEAWERSIQLIEAAYGPESAVTASSLLEASATAEARGRTDDQGRLLSRAFEIGAGLPETSGVRARTALELGRLRMEQGRPREAVEPLQRALEGREALSRTRHDSGAVAAADRATALLGRALVASERIEDGRRLIETALPELERALGDDHSETAAARAALHAASGS